MNVRERIREFIETNYFAGSDLEDTVSLLDRGIIDSTGVLELIGYLEDAFQIRIEDQELVPANLDSVANLVAFVERKQRVLFNTTSAVLPHR